MNDRISDVIKRYGHPIDKLLFTNQFCVRLALYFLFHFPMFKANIFVQFILKSMKNGSHIEIQPRSYYRSRVS